jgi:hypothetical protein
LGFGLTTGFFGSDCNPDAPLGVDDVEGLGGGGSCLIVGLFGGAPSIALSNSCSSSSSYAFFVGGSGAEGATTGAILKSVRKGKNGGTDDHGRRLRDSEGRLEGIVLLPPQATFIRESSFSRVKVCAIRNKEEVSDGWSGT